MNPNMLKAMRQKKKRAVNPDIPRPNLFTHEKKLKEIGVAAEQSVATIAELQERIRKLERKLASQTDYLNMVHQRLMRK